MTRRICVVTGTRADYGLLRWLMHDIRNDEALELQVVATGMHLSPEFGSTSAQIEADGFRIDRKVEMLLSSDSAEGVTKSIGLGVIGFADALRDLRPDVVVLLGDRFEILAVAVAALVARIPVAHLHGGERTEGAFDESIRHAITKMSHLHFVAAEEYRRRVLQLGEQPGAVFNVGGLGLDNVRRLELLDRGELETQLGYPLLERNLLITFHPATLEEADEAAGQFGELLHALAGRSDTRLIFTLPNADTGGRALIKMIGEFVARHSNARMHVSLGQLRYLSCVAHVDGVVGNSSSGIIEAPAFRTGTVDIGNRQRGRLFASSIIHCEPERGGIVAALDTLYSPGFRNGLASVHNPYGDGGASARIVEVLRVHPLEGLLMKPFVDLPGVAV